MFQLRHWLGITAVRKLCVDVDLLSSRMNIRWDAVMRDHAGRLNITSNENIGGILSPDQAKSVAIRQALKVVKDNGHDEIILALDCLSVIQRVLSLV